MVKVDDLNESIEAFGSIVKRFDEIQESCKMMDKVIKKEEENLEEIKQACNYQKALLDAEKGLELSIDRKIENVESVLKDRIELSGYDSVNKITSELKSSSENIKHIVEQKSEETQKKIQESTDLIIRNLVEVKNMIWRNSNDTKKRDTVMGIGIAVAIVLQIINFFI